MKNSQSNQLAKFAWAKYLEAHDEYQNSSMFGGGGAWGNMEMCESLLARLNEIFDAQYVSGKQILSLQERYLKNGFRQEHGLSFGSFKRIFEHYTEPHRYYHTLAHISRGLGELDLVREQLEKPEEVELAWWYHDGIYVPGAPDNEEKSWEFLLEEGKVSQKESENLQSLILGTKSHTNPQNNDQAYLMDVDLSVMGGPFEMFNLYGKEIRQEYSAIPEAIFVEHRKRFLAEFLTRTQIYHTSYFREHYELTARLNLQKELELLEAAKGL